MWKAIEHLWQERQDKWLLRRLPTANSTSLNRKNIFILPTSFGWLQLALSIVLFLLGTNYQNNLMLLLCYFLLALFLLSLFSCYFNFRSLTIRHSDAPEGFGGCPIPMKLEIIQAQKQLAHGRIHISFAQRSSDRTSVELENPTTEITLNSPFSQRGSYPIPRVQIMSFYPLGLFRCWSYLHFKGSFVIFPIPLKGPEPLHLYSSPPAQENKTPPAHNFQGYQEFDRLKPYEKGQPLYHVDWKQLAKGRGLLSKAFSDSYQDLNQFRLRDYASLPTEVALQHLAWSVVSASENNRAFSLELNSQHIPVGQGQQHRMHCLRALANYPRQELES